MPFHPTPMPNFPLSSANGRSTCYSVNIMPSLPSPTPDFPPSSANGRSTCCSVNNMPSYPTPTPNFPPSSANGRSTCYSVTIMPSLPSPTPDSPLSQCKWPQHLLFYKYHAFPTAKFRPILHPFRPPTPPREKNYPRHLGTFGDIWGLMSHFHTKIARTSVPL